MSKNLRPRGYFGKGTVEVALPERPGEGGIRRLEVEKDALVTEPVPGVSTISDIIDYAAQKHGQEKSLGWRDVITVHDEKKEIKKVVDGKEKTETKTWKYFELSDYKYMDYIQLRDAISEIARAYVDLGIGQDDVLDIFAQTRCVYVGLLTFSELKWPTLFQSELAADISRMRPYIHYGSHGLRYPW